MQGKLKTIITAAILAVAIAQYANYSFNHPADNVVSPKISLAFLKWTQRQNKLYLSPSEYAHRLTVFAENYETVRKWRLNYSRTYELGLGVFADLSDEEFGAKFGMVSQEERIAAQWKNDGSFGGPNCKNSIRRYFGLTGFRWEGKRGKGR